MEIFILDYVSEKTLNYLINNEFVYDVLEGSRRHFYIAYIYIHIEERNNGSIMKNEYFFYVVSRSITFYFTKSLLKIRK